MDNTCHTKEGEEQRGNWTWFMGGIHVWKIARHTQTRLLYPDWGRYRRRPYFTRAKEQYTWGGRRVMSVLGTCTRRGSTSWMSLADCSSCTAPTRIPHICRLAMLTRHYAQATQVYGQGCGRLTRSDSLRESGSAHDIGLTLSESARPNCSSHDTLVWVVRMQVEELGDPAMPRARSPGIRSIAENVATPHISWNEAALQPLMSPVPGDVLVTLDRSNVATIAYWSSACQLPSVDLDLLGAWVIKLCDIHTRPTPGMEYPVGFPERFRCLRVITWKFAEGVWGLQGCPDLCIPRLISLPQEPGLGCNTERTSPSSHNLFVNLFAHDMPAGTPMLQVEWWVPVFDQLPIPNAWVLGIWDSPTGELAWTRSISSWYGGRGCPWLQDGVSAICIIPIAPSAADTSRMELGPCIAPMEEPAGDNGTSVSRALAGELTRARATVQTEPAETWAATPAW